jgi:DNA-binding CsgD family transcriptional regulator
MEFEIDNVRWVLRRCVNSGNFSHGTDLVTSMSWYWITRATTEGVWWLDQLLASRQGNAQTLAWAYFIRGFLAVLQNDPAAARPALEQAVVVAKEAGQVTVLSHALSMASIVENMAGERVAARRFLDRAAAVTADVDDLDAKVGLLQARALEGVFTGDLDAVKAASAEGVRLSRAAGDLYSLEMMLLNLGFAALIEADLDESKTLFAEALEIANRIDDRVAQYALLDALGCQAAKTGRARLAAQLLGAAETVRGRAGANVIGYLSPMLAEAEESARGALGASRFEAEFQAGRRLSRRAAVGLALGEPVQVPAVVANEHHAGPLGIRQGDVAHLVAEGLSNKQIGERLFISERTVDSHIRNILNKLGFQSRAQIAAWIVSTNR